MAQLKKRICVIGAGNVATHLAAALAQVADVVQIVSRHEASASAVAAAVGGNCTFAASLADVVPDADFYIIAVNDDRVAEVVRDTPDYPGIWAHTSGSVPAQVFSGYKTHYGVFYPLQTFSRDARVDVARVPFFIEGNTPDVACALRGLAESVSTTVEDADSDRRKVLHLAAVFACNFANLMWWEADEILKREGLGVKYLMPLLSATLDKLNQLPPYDAMTGPARRGDTAVIDSHCAMLPEESRQIYRMLSDAILKNWHKPKSGNDEVPGCGASSHID